jgi:hypothetical protein
MDLTEYRESDSEKARTNDLIRIIENLNGPSNNALDIGARDGHFSKLLAKYYDSVIALDLEKPSFKHDNVTCIQGDVTNLKFDDGDFNLVFCAEVLEHIPTNMLKNACSELSRVSNNYILIGVPYKQDIRAGRLTCYSCGKINPPWGHVNSFNDERLESLFPEYCVKEKFFVGKVNSFTNSISTALMDYAGNPYGTYSQEEPCIHCGKKIILPPKRTLLQKVATKISFYIKYIQTTFTNEHPNWIHVLFQRKRHNNANQR